MKIILTAVIAVFAVLPLSAQDEVYGAGITLKEKTEVSDILQNPESYLGKTVMVEGKVLDVCQHAGCWMEIEGSQPGEVIKVKVKDGEIVFPVEAKGKTAKVEGEIYSIEMDEEQAVEYFEHLAEDAGKKFDPSTVTGPVTIYQIKGLGAVIPKFEKAPDTTED